MTFVVSYTALLIDTALICKCWSYSSVCKAQPAPLTLHNNELTQLLVGTLEARGRSVQGRDNLVWLTTMHRKYLYLTLWPSCNNFDTSLLWREQWYFISRNAFNCCFWFRFFRLVSVLYSHFISKSVSMLWRCWLSVKNETETVKYHSNNRRRIERMASVFPFTSCFVKTVASAVVVQKSANDRILTSSCRDALKGNC